MRRKILVMKDIKPRADHGLARLRARLQVRQPIAALQPVADPEVSRVGGVERRREHPLAQPEDGAGLQDARDVAVDLQERGRVDRRFDGVGGVETARGKGEILLDDHLVHRTEKRERARERQSNKRTRKSPRTKVHLSLSPACAVR